MALAVARREIYRKADDSIMHGLAQQPSWSTGG